VCLLDESAARANSAAAIDSRIYRNMAALTATRKHRSDPSFTPPEILLQEARWTWIRDRSRPSSPVYDDVLQSETRPPKPELPLPQ
jgi:hypothetical protein